MKNKIILLLVALAQFSNTQFSIAQESFLDFEAVKKSATLEDKTILMVFSGSDWCKPCIQFKENILKDDRFSTEQNETLLLYLDFPYKKQNALSKKEQIHNEVLAEKYNPDGQFPKIILLDSKGELLNEIKYQKAMDYKTFAHELNSIKTK